MFAKHPDKISCELASSHDVLTGLVAKHDLQTRPIYHHKRESIDAHLSIVFAALPVSHRIEHQTGWSIKKFVRTARRYRTVRIKAGRQILTAADPLPDDLRDILAKNNAGRPH